VNVLLRTERLSLRHFVPQDRDALMDVFGDVEVMRFGDGVQTKAWVEEWLRLCIESYRTRGFGPYAVVEEHSGNLIGYCGLFYFADVNGQAEIEIGYRLARSAWGKGYATEAVRAVQEYAFNTLNIKRLIAIIDPSNVASIRVAEKIGMHYEADVMFEGYNHPDHVYAVVS
jgi:RimJ/RimL family protein N-acetyltransferase